MTVDRQTKFEDLPELLTVEEVCAYLGIGRTTVYASLLKIVLSQPSRTALGEVLAESLERIEGHFRGVLERGVAVGAVRADVPVALLSQLAMATGEVMDRWTLRSWELLTPEELAELPREMLTIHMRVIAPLPLLVEREQGGGRGPLAKENP